MKANLGEFDYCFTIDLSAETMEDAINIARCGINHTMELTYVSAHVQEYDYRDGATNDNNFTLSLVIGKRKQQTSDIGHRK